MSSRQAGPRSIPRLVTLALTGCFAGGLVSIAGCHWLLWAHGDDLQICDDIYADCMAESQDPQHQQSCKADVQACYEACEAGWVDDDSHAGDDTDADAGGPGGGTDDAGDDAGDDADDGEDEGETGDETSVCIALFSNCLSNAETLQDVEACENLFDQCINPGECPSCGGCPTDALDACLSSYASCAEVADTPEKVQACKANFEECTAPFAAECEVDENPNLEPCLEQHELCVACAEDEPQLQACQVVFDSCLSS